MARGRRPPTWRFAALALSTLHHAQARQADLDFPDCVSSCVKDNGCRAADVKCMCKASRSTSFLPDVVTCMYGDCSPGVDVDTLLSPLEFNCQVLGIPIPDSAISSAEAAASSVENPGPTTTTVVVTTTPTSVHKTTATTPTAAHTTTKGEPASTWTTTASTETSTSVDNNGDGTTVTSSTADVQSTAASLSSGTSPTSGSSPGTTTNTGGATDPTDSSPFATPINSGRGERASLIGTVLGLAAVLVLGW